MMKYQAPQLTTLANAISAIQSPTNKTNDTPVDNIRDLRKEGVSAYQDWE
jgi:hypothetical protein